MILTTNTLFDALNKAYAKYPLYVKRFERFLAALKVLLNNTKREANESYVVTNVQNFLKDGIYENSYLINTADRIDLAIYNGGDSNDSVGVIIECKSLVNTNEMLSQDNIYAKALLEAIAYYLEQSISLKNKEVKHVIITNSEMWYVFDASEFERKFYNNSKIKKDFEQYKNKLLGVYKTDWYYKYIEESILPSVDELHCTCFNLLDFKELIKEYDNNKDENSRNELINLYKFLAPENLLKVPFANDSNYLDTQFYDELLYILGIEEVKEEGKKLLVRLPEGRRIPGSILENTINSLKVNDKVKNLKEFGDTEDEQLFSIGLELTITWLNRILFLKLFESQLVDMHLSEYSHKFLDYQKVTEYDDWQELFFEVMAVKPVDRTEDIDKKYPNIPYLNSSLFEITELEQKTITISQLKDRYTMPYFSATVLKNMNGSRICGEERTQIYMLKFLDAYKFGSEGNDRLQKTEKSVISAAVLGLIFEKINGYKDGSFFTPGAITMYICRNALNAATINKFNEKYNWNCKNLVDVYNAMHNDSKSIKEYNEVIENISFLDPAVGSGHFLVSAINEFIRIKSELGILVDSDGKRLKDYKIEIQNDELLITDSEGNYFNYIAPDLVAGAKRVEMQRVQKTIFHEKKNIIEKCIFGADINPKSVYICRLRLWIELLKFMYYKDPEQKEPEILPNIDINIKVGDSLVSRYAVDDSALTKKDAKLLKEFKQYVGKYKNCDDKKDRQKINSHIEELKTMFGTILASKSVAMLALNEAKDELMRKTSEILLFSSEKERQKHIDDVQKLTELVAIKQHEYDKVDENELFQSAIEWRFAFPEVLDDEGKFTGFDVVVANPPYIQLQKAGGKLADKYSAFNYSTYNRMGDIYSLFIELGVKLLKTNGVLSMITSNKWMRAGYGENTRKFLTESANTLEIIDFAGVKVFENATVDTDIILLKKQPYEKKTRACIAKDKSCLNDLSDYFKQNLAIIEFKPGESWTILSPIEQSIKAKIEAKGTPLKDWDIQINYGIKTGYNEAFIISTDKKDEILSKCRSQEEREKTIEIIRPILRGRDIKRYGYEWADLWLINTHNGVKESNISPIDVNELPAIKEHLDKYYTKISKRQDKGITPYNLRNCSYMEDFYRKKIMYSEIVKSPQFYLDNECKFFPEATTFIMTGKHLEYLYNLFHSHPITYFFKTYYAGGGLGDNGYRYKKAFFENLPIPKWQDTELQNQIELSSPNDNIDKLVFDLYGLNAEETDYINKDY